FITSKKDAGALQNFNISVAVTDAFMKAAAKGKTYNLINPRTGKPAGKLNAKDVLNTIVTMGWHNGEPGLLFIDEVNRKNPTPFIGEIESTNPCGEQPLLPYESCNLGSVNLSRFVIEVKKEIDWKRLESTVRLAVRFLDNVIDANKFPIPDIEDMTKANRKIGLGVMGFADMLIKLGVSYDSRKAVSIAGKVMKFAHSKALDASKELAKQRGSFPTFQNSRLAKKHRMMRNAAVTTVAPTGTISIIAGCSSGIEPLFGVSFVRNVLDGSELMEVNQEFARAADERGFSSKKLMREIASHGSVQKVPGVPQDIKRLFVTAHNITPEWHIRIQAEFQKHTDSAVSKTINFPKTATLKDIEKAYKLAHKLKCKGITVYRHGSRDEQVLTFSPEYSGGCPGKECTF
ncbi:adenosylcobalamin-dependent ribonucleoside-diphosphate reductase, partial [Candidatus Woesearchaeota archaeon]|nr:adenosylcobalamin-dependent ribonucleoside-diphosphate reductase [Candidatus Woesearchaeota archaeon]